MEEPSQNHPGKKNNDKKMKKLQKAPEICAESGLGIVSTRHQMKSSIFGRQSVYIILYTNIRANSGF